jgi:hypothetical protein
MAFTRSQTRAAKNGDPKPKLPSTRSKTRVAKKAGRKPKMNSTRSQIRATKNIIVLNISSNHFKKHGGAVTRSQTRAGYFTITPALPNSPCRESRKRQTRIRLNSYATSSSDVSLPVPSPSAFTSTRTSEEDSTYNSVTSDSVSEHADYDPENNIFFPSFFGNQQDVSTASSGTEPMDFIGFQTSSTSLPTAGRPRTPVEVSGFDSSEISSSWNDTILSNLDEVNNENGEAGTPNIQLMPSQTESFYQDPCFGLFDAQVIPISFHAETTTQTEASLDIAAMDLSVDFVTNVFQ